MKWSFVIAALLSLGPVGSIVAQVPVVTKKDLTVYRELLSRADIVHLDGAVVVERKPGYQVKWNSITFLPDKKKDCYGHRRLVGGVNQSSEALLVVALIPLYEYRGYKQPESEISQVKVNGQSANCFLFSSGNASADAINAAKNAFPNEKLFKSQLDSNAPLLFIAAGKIGSGESVKIEYETRSRGPIKINRAEKSR